MFNLSYYFIDVGENLCEIYEMNLLFSITESIKKKDKARLMLIKEVIKNTFKKMSPTSELTDFKVVFINKRGKITLESEVNDSLTFQNVEPVVVTEANDIYIVRPGQSVSIRAQINPNEFEIRYINFDEIKSTHKVQKNYTRNRNRQKI